MQGILIVYGTTDGHTRKIAHRIADMVADLGCPVVTRDARKSRHVNAGDFEAVIIAASLHARGYQRPVTRWIEDNADALRTRPTLFISVCLAILEKDPAVRHEAGAIAERFVLRHGWRPSEIQVVAGALPYTRYGWLKKLIMRRIAARAGGDTDTTRDFEYTDFDAVEGFVHGFVRQFEFAEEKEEELVGAM
jgi:menaquinone-dependent protoporphyrinogen oxidase